MDAQVKDKPAGRTARADGGNARLSPDQLVEVIELLKGANSVELKLMVADSQRAAIGEPSHCS